MRFYNFPTVVRILFDNIVLLYFRGLFQLTHKHRANEGDPKHMICGQIEQFNITMGVKLLNKGN